MCYKIKDLKPDQTKLGTLPHLHGSPLGEGDLKIFPLPVLVHHMGKDDMAVAAGPGQLRAICGPGEVKDAECVGLFHGVGPLDDRGKEGKWKNSSPKCLPKGGRGCTQIIYESSNSKPKADEYAEQTQSNKVHLITASDAERDIQLFVVSAGANGGFFFPPVFHFYKKKKILIQRKSADTVEVQQQFKVFQFVVFPGHSLVSHGGCRERACRS